MTWMPWLVLLGYGVLVYRLAPKRASDAQFFDGGSDRGAPPGIWLLAASAAISWIFAKSIANAADLTHAFGLWGGVGYALYYLSFFVAAAAIYLIRTRGGDRSLPAFLIRKYGSTCAKLFLIAIAIRLFNEVWSNTKVASLYFAPADAAMPELSWQYWVAVALITGFTLFYAWRGGLRSSLITDAVQMVFVAVLLGIVLVMLMPELAAKGLPRVDSATRSAGVTFCLLALVQVWSYPFHDPVLTDRGFITPPRSMVTSFVLAGLMSAGFILLFGIVGLHARSQGMEGAAYVAVPAAFGLPMLMLVNGIMLTSAGSTLDSTFASAAKLAARDWRDVKAQPTARQTRVGRWVMVVVALVGNLPLLSVFFEQAGPAVIAATTVSGTMVMGLAPIFLLAWIRPAGALSFHLALWPGMALGAGLVLEGMGYTVFPDAVAVGEGKYAMDLGVNLYGLGVCTAGYLGGAAISWARDREAMGVPQAAGVEE